MHLVSAPSVTAIALLAFSVSSLPGQTVELRLREDSLGVPIVGAIVRLFHDKSVVSQGLTDESGRVVLRGRSAGTYRLSIARIGWTGLEPAPFALDSGQVLRLSLGMSSKRVLLPSIEVRSTSNCSAKGREGEVAAALWQEINKALTANLITERQGLVPLHLREFLRDVDLSGKPLREWITTSRIIRGPPFASLAAASLVSTGFVFEQGDTAVFAAPDASLLLSDQFIETHCFGSRESKSGLAALAFRPTSGRRVPDVSGTGPVGAADLTF